jgi:hypothetical protein
MLRQRTIFAPNFGAAGPLAPQYGTISKKALFSIT